MSLFGVSVVFAVVVLGGLLAVHYRVHRARLDRIQVEAEANSRQPNNPE